MLQKAAFNEFDFYRNNTPKGSISEKLAKALCALLGLQVFFLATDIFTMHQQMDAVKEKYDKAYSHYRQLESALENGNQEKIIDEFSKIKHIPTALADGVAGDAMIMMKTADNPYKSYLNYKIDAKTLETVQYIYMNNYNSGIEAEKKMLNNISCMWIDFVCIIGRHVAENSIDNLVMYSEKKIKAHYYDITHWDEYKVWDSSVREKNRNKTDVLSDYNTPGQVYVNKKYQQ